MKKTSKTIPFIGILLLAVLTVNPASAAVIIVDNSAGASADYTTISAAVANASTGDTVLVFPGIYTEYIDVSKELVIKSSSGNPDDTIVKTAGPYEDEVFYVSAYNVTISGFSISGDLSSYITTSYPYYDYYENAHGIYLDEVENCSIKNNSFSDCDYSIRLYYSNYNNLYNNTLDNSYRGIYIYESDNNNFYNNTLSNDDFGIYIYESDNNNFSGNIISNTSSCGIYLYYSDNNNLSANKALDGEYGIYLYSSEENNLTGNLMQNNIYNFKASGYFIDNTVDTSNTVDGKPIYYLVNVMSPTEINSSSNAGTVCLVNCQNIMVKDLVLKNNGAGIYLYNTGNSVLKNNTLENNEYDIYMHYSDNNNLTGNTLGSASRFGTYIYDSDHNVLSYNTLKGASYFGIDLHYSDNNNLTGNDVSDGGYGIYLHSSEGNNLTGNLMQNNSYNFKADGSLRDNDIGTSNTVDGKPIYYLENVVAPTEINSSSNAGTVYLVRCKNITVKDLMLKNNGAGIYLYYTENSTLKNNTLEDDENGIYLLYSEGNDLQDNRASEGEYGIYLYYSDNNDLLNNSASETRDCGIHLYESDGNKIRDNSASGNYHAGIYLSDSFDNSLSNNTISENDYGGFYLWESGNNSLFNNTISENDLFGLLLEESSNSILRNNFITGSDYNFLLNFDEVEECKYDIDTSNLVDGKPIYYLVNRADIPAEYFEDAGTVYLINCSNVTVRDQTLKNNGYGLFAFNVSDSSFEDNLISKNMYGICVESSTYVTLKGNNLDLNMGAISIDDSEHNILTHNEVSGPLTAPPGDEEEYFYYYYYYDFEYLAGICVEDSSYNNLSSNDVDSYLIGIEIDESYYNNLTDNTADSNIVGIVIQESDTNNLGRNNVNSNYLGGILIGASNNNLTENTVTSNGRVISSFEGIESFGIFLLGCENSKLTGNRIQDNEASGLCLMYSAGNEIYDNYFNNLKNVEFENELPFYKGSRSTVSSSLPEPVENAEPEIEDIFSPESMNQEPDAETRETGIFGNEETGLEFFGEVEEKRIPAISSGRSLVGMQIPYTVENVWNTSRTEGENVMGGAYLGGNCWGLPDGSGWSQTCDDADGDGICDLPYNITDDGNNVDYLPLVKPPEPATEESSTGGSSNSPRYIPAASGDSNVKTVIGAQQRVTAGREAHLQFGGTETSILGVVFTAEKYSGIVAARVEVLDGAASEPDEKPEGIVFQQMNILIGNEHFESSENINRAYIDFRVSRTWVEENNIDISTITLNRFNDGKWNPLTTEMTGEDEEYFYFRAETPGFSRYSITGERVNTCPTSDESGNMEINPAGSDSDDSRPSAASAPEKEEQSPGFGPIATAICLMLSVGLIKRKF